MSGQYVNLDQVGVLTHAGKGYAGNAEDSVGDAKNYLSKMEGAQSGFKGAAGSTFQGVSNVTATNLGHLARQMAEQAKRAVLTEKSAVTGDENATQNQHSAKSATDSFTSTVSRPINV